MPAITSGRVLVTGANGFVAVWILKYLLERSFSVRGTVRSERKGAYLKELFKSFGDKLEIVVVEDITKPDAFDAALDGVDGVLHVASPVDLAADDPNDLIVPAVKGAENVLQSVMKHRDTVKRVVITSSCTAVMTPPHPPAPGVPPQARVFSEHDWNEYSVEEVRTKGRAALPMDKYRASKVHEERTAWAIYERERERARATGEELGWDLVSLAPPLVFGPVLHEAPTVDNGITGTARMWHKYVVQGASAEDAPVKGGYAWVDVRDFAHSEILALITPEAGGERFIISAGRFTWQESIDAARRYSDTIPPGDESFDLSKVQYLVEYNADKSRRILGISYRSIDECARDSLEVYKGKGWL
ncbi:NAD-P-binding protein [Trametes elegans]|nr:NAD-P-binding protein [Trametes elegans]